jgi:hypothetical protein
MTAALPAAAVIGWIGRKPPEDIKCNKPTGICGYLDCADESRCLERPRAKPSPSLVASDAQVSASVPRVR